MINALFALAKEHAVYPLHSVLMFTEANAHVIQMLDDNRYRQALQDMTGRDIALFYTQLLQGAHELPTPHPGWLCMLMPIWKEPKANKQLLALFGMRDSTSLPCLVTFLFADGDIHFTESRIAMDSPQVTFNSTEEIIKRLVKAAHESRDRLDAMKKARFEMRALNFRKGIREFLKQLGTIRGAAGI